MRCRKASLNSMIIGMDRSCLTSRKKRRQTDAGEWHHRERQGACCTDSQKEDAQHESSYDDATNVSHQTWLTFAAALGTFHPTRRHPGYKTEARYKTDAAVSQQPSARANAPPSFPIYPDSADTSSSFNIVKIFDILDKTAKTPCVCVCVCVCVCL